MTNDAQPNVEVPLDYPTSLIYVDESGSASNGRVFVVGALKVRRHGTLVRQVKAVRDRYDFTDEFRFNRISRGSVHRFTALLDTVLDADVVFAATIVDRHVFDPTKAAPHWRAQADVTSRLLRACINKRELVSVSIDSISTPPDVALEDYIASCVNRRLGSKRIVTAALLDSKTCDCLQLVDVLTSAVACDYRRSIGIQPKVSAHKAAVVDRAKLVLGVSEFVGRSQRRNVQVLQAPAPKRPKSDSVISLTRRRTG